jgi:hypothetical protein
MGSQTRDTYEMPGADHHKELAGGLRQLARQCRFAGARSALLRLAANCERRGGHFDWHSQRTVDLSNF